jgi:hypothetical protein
MVLKTGPKKELEKGVVLGMVLKTGPDRPVQPVTGA